MQISILIVNWNTRDFLRDCLESLQEVVAGLDTEIIVVDNASTDGSADMVREDFPSVCLIHNNTNRGFSAANNQAARQARGEYWLLLNADAQLFPDTLPCLISFLQNNHKVGAVGPRILNPDGTLQVSCTPRPTLSREAWRMFHLDRLLPYGQYSKRLLARQSSIPVDVLLGACILLRREAFEQIPGIQQENSLFDEQFFMYSEEVDLCLRIQKAGWLIYWLPTCKAIHYGGQSTRQNADEMFLELYRNKVKYFRKHEGRLATNIHKGIIYLAACIRWLLGSLFANTNIGKRHGWSTLSRRYRRLMTELTRF